MKNLLGFLLLILCTITLFPSCMKEIRWNLNTADTTTVGGTVPPSTNGDLLVKTFSQAPGSTDSSVSYYSYNSAKQLLSVRSVASASGGVTNWIGFERNATGLVIRQKTYTRYAVAPAPTDTIVTAFTYTSGTTPRIHHSITTQTVSGTVLNDSIIYTYNTAGKLTEFQDFQNLGFSGYSPLSKAVFTYDASGNTTKLEFYDLVSGSPNLLTSQQLTYDAKTISLTLTDAESIALAKQPAPVHNALTRQATSVSGLPNTNTVYTYTYNTFNRPATSKQTDTVSGTTTSTVTNTTYYYQ